MATYGFVKDFIHHHLQRGTLVKTHLFRAFIEAYSNVDLRNSPRLTLSSWPTQMKRETSGRSKGISYLPWAWFPDSPSSGC